MNGEYKLMLPSQSALQRQLLSIHSAMVITAKKRRYRQLLNGRCKLLCCHRFSANQYYLWHFWCFDFIGPFPGYCESTGQRGLETQICICNVNSALLHLSRLPASVFSINLIWVTGYPISNALCWDCIPIEDYRISG